MLDPIDGTKNYSRGVPAWATLIGLTVHGRAVVGVASAPALGRRWWGAQGLGAWTSENGGPPRRITVSGVADLADAYLSTTDFRTFTQPRRPAALDRAGRRVLGDAGVRRLLAVLPRRRGGDRRGGRPGGQRRGTSPRCVPILDEAGGRLTDLDGVATHDGGNALASNGHVHDAALTVLRGG